MKTKINRDPFDLGLTALALMGIAGLAINGFAGGFDHTVKLTRLNGVGAYWDISTAACIEVMAIVGTVLFVVFHRKGWKCTGPLALIITGVVVTLSAQVAYKAAPTPNVVLGYTVVITPTVTTLMCMWVAHLWYALARPGAPTAPTAPPTTAPQEVHPIEEVHCTSQEEVHLSDLRGAVIAGALHLSGGGSVGEVQSSQVHCASEEQVQPAGEVRPITEVHITKERTSVSAPARGPRPRGERDVTRHVQVVASRRDEFSHQGKLSIRRVKEYSWAEIGLEGLASKYAEKVVREVESVTVERSSSGVGGVDGGVEREGREVSGEGSTPLHHDRDGSLTAALSDVAGLMAPQERATVLEATRAYQERS